GDPIEMFRTSLVSDGLSYGAAYYPWLRTSLTPPARATYESLSFEARKRLFDLVNADPGIYMPSLSARERSRALDLMEQIKLLNPLVSPREIPKRLAPEKLHAELLGSVPLYAEIMERLDRRPILLPPSAAMAAIMSKVDKDRGVWKAPANVSVMGVTELMVNIDNAAQVDLNTPISGKSVNAIRMFPTEGPLVWGARTLDGNSAEWRYINVRRTMIMIEQSIKAAISAYVFEPNDSDTWAAIKSMVSNYLTNLWSQGAFAGVTPSEAFNVSIGLGRTMTAQDILEDRLIVSVLVALVRPAEFIVLNFTQTQQRS
ncbi:MAG: phage tail sheath C-terminal domain-containing protein, partial [Pseudomonadota bacterium]